MIQVLVQQRLLTTKTGVRCSMLRSIFATLAANVPAVSSARLAILTT